MCVSAYFCVIKFKVSKGELCCLIFLWSVSCIHVVAEMGLSEGKTTICHGKPGCPNIRLVKFNGTLTGLQEAERLDNIFSEKKHGRAELQEVDVGVSCGEGSAQEAENKSEDTLYGYLGIVEDFDKLNYDMRRHSVAKSKRELLAHANTTT